uniref:Secreted ookinete protein n=1 Tax=Parastrongyloides trichosuri TaxID=131310 RepID=A0A0N4ZWW0_PARTI
MIFKKYLFIYFMFYFNVLLFSKNIDIIESSGEEGDYPDIDIDDLLSYDQGLPMPKFPILARSSSKSGLISLNKGLTSFTSGLTDEMRKLLNEDKRVMKFSRRKNDKVDSASVHKIIVEAKKDNKMLESHEEDLYDKMPEEKGQFLVEKMPLYLGAMTRSKGMKSVNAFGVYGKSRMNKPFTGRSNGYGSFVGESGFKLKPGQYFAGQVPPTHIQQVSQPRELNNNVIPTIQKGVNFRDIDTIKKQYSNTMQKLLTAANSAAHTYNSLKKNKASTGIINEPNNKITIDTNVVRVPLGSKLNLTSKNVVHGISMSQFRKFPTIVETNHEYQKQNNFLLNSESDRTLNTHPNIQDTPQQIVKQNNSNEKLKIEDFNDELPNPQISNIELTTCCDGSVIYSAIPCCTSVINTNYNDFDNKFSKNKQLNSDEYGDFTYQPKFNPSFKSYKSSSRIKNFVDENNINYSPLPEIIGDIYSNNFGNFNA